MAKSLTKTMTVDYALHSHRCRFNKRHAIAKGDKRLTVKEGRSEMRYCVECAKKFLRTGIDKLNTILSEL